MLLVLLFVVFVSIPFVSGREHSPYSLLPALAGNELRFQSPSFRGGSTPRRLAWALLMRSLVSIPFVSGREHSHEVRIAVKAITVRFNPLRFGAGALPREKRE